jgi:anti-sigma regulatory factor (Ser/Thr protein kinase)
VGKLTSVTMQGRIGTTSSRALGRFRSEASEVAQARRLVRATLAEWGLGEHILALELAVSELVSNAVVHGEGTIEVELTRTPGDVRLQVVDAGGGEPVLQPPSAPDARIGGWGLGLVDEVADDWGSASEDKRTTVWLVRHTSSLSPDKAAPSATETVLGIPPFR